MHYKIYFPSQDLHPFIVAYFIMGDGADNTIQTSYLIPNGCPQILFYCKNPVKYYLKATVPVSYQYIIGGQLSKPVFFRHSGYSEAIVIMFRPAGIYHLFKIPQSELRDKLEDLNLLLDRKKNDIERIVTSATDDVKIQQTEKFLRGLIKDGSVYSDVDSAINIIDQSFGNCNIKDILSTLNAAARTFERNFFKIVGLNPKEYAKIIRFNRIFELVKKNPQLDWQDIILLCGYYDQAHLIRDFRRFANISPKHFYDKKYEIGKLLLDYSNG